MQRHRLPASASSIAASSGVSSAVRVEANSAITKPGVQKPHCEPWQSTIACCTGCSARLGVLQVLDREELAAVERGHELDAGVDRAVDQPAALAPRHHHRAGAAVALVAAFLGAGAPLDSRSQSSTVIVGSTRSSCLSSWPSRKRTWSRMVRVWLRKEPLLSATAGRPADPRASASVSVGLVAGPSSSLCHLPPGRPQPPSHGVIPHADGDGEQGSDGRSFKANAKPADRSAHRRCPRVPRDRPPCRTLACADPVEFLPPRPRRC